MNPNRVDRSGRSSPPRRLGRFPNTAGLAGLFWAGLFWAGLFWAGLFWGTAASESFAQSIGENQSVGQDLPVVVGVKTVMPAAPAESPEPEPPRSMPGPEIPLATLPAARWPQYQTGDYRSETVANVTDGKGEIEFLLNAPSLLAQIGRPLKVAVRVLIDGEPFQQFRRQKSLDLTENATAVSETKPSSPEESSAKETDASESQPPYQLTTDPEEFTSRYTAAMGDGETLSAEEADWLLTHWLEGPPLLLLQPYFQSFRAGERPVFVVLDRDRDGVISSRELNDAVESVQRCDANRDDIVDVLELSESAQVIDKLNSVEPIAPPVLRLISDLAGISREELRQDPILQSLDTDQDGRLGSPEIKTWKDRSPDLRCTVQFRTDDPQRSEIRVTDVSDELVSVIDVTREADTIVVKIGHARLRLNAVQGQSDSQVSLGAVIDGYPLLPSIDPNDDGRLTIRELRQLTERIKSWDDDGDGQVTSEEASPPVRVCVGLGGTVHQELASIRSVPQRDMPDPIQGPEWFVRMDRNRDNDLTPQEFPGTREQFKALDTNGDALISADEAHQLDSQPSN